MKDLSPLLDVYNNGGFKPLNDSEPSIYLGDFEETEANLDIIEILIEAGIKVFLPNNNQ